QGRLPCTLVNADSELPVPLVIADEYDGGVQNAKHLIELGHRKISFLIGKPPAHYSVTERLRGYVDTMRQAGLAENVQIFDGAVEEFVQLMRTDARPTAVIVY